VREQQAGPLKRLVAEVGAERLVEAARGFLGVAGEQRACVPQPYRDAGSRDVTGCRLDLPHARSCLVDPAGVQRGFGKLADEPARDDRVMGRARRIEEAFTEAAGNLARGCAAPPGSPTPGRSGR
jgi:hypothetical protein